MANNVTVIGSGAWGRALAKFYSADNIIAGRSEAKEINADVVFVAVEAQKFREVISRHKFSPDSIIIVCSKGIEQGTLKLVSEIVEEVLPHNPYAVLSGPNFADELEAGLPTASTIACESEALGKNLVERFGRANMRLYWSSDIIAAQLGGAIKNVLAIAAGICVGKKLGDNARAALITRGLAEMGRLVKARGGDERNLLGPAGIGDLILTCGSEKSRNTRFGMELALGGHVDYLIANNSGVVEGYYTAKSVYDLAKKINVEMPICFSVYEILYKDKAVDEAINDLLERPQGQRK